MAFERHTREKLGDGVQFGEALRSTTGLIRAVRPLGVTAIRMKYERGVDARTDSRFDPPLPHVSIVLHVAGAHDELGEDHTAAARQRILANAPGAYEIKYEWKRTDDLGFHGNRVRVTASPTPTLDARAGRTLQPKHASRLARILSTPQLFLKEVTLTHAPSGIYADIYCDSRRYPGRIAPLLALRALRSCAKELPEHWEQAAVQSPRQGSVHTSETLETFTYDAPHGLNLFAHLTNLDPLVTLSKRLAAWDGQMPPREPEYVSVQSLDIRDFR